MGNTDKLLPCPFCGASGDSFVSVNKSYDNYYVKCFECGARSGVCETEEDAFCVWNTREEAERALKGGVEE